MIRLHQFIPFVKVLDTELRIGCAAVIVLDDGVADIDWIAGLDMVEIVGHIKGYGRYMMVRMRLLNELKLKMTAFSTHLASHAVVIYVIGTEDRSRISRSERLELLEDTKEFRRDLREIQQPV